MKTLYSVQRSRSTRALKAHRLFFLCECFFDDCDVRHGHTDQQRIIIPPIIQLGTVRHHVKGATDRGYFAVNSTGPHMILPF